jgi:hypothetical protein
MPRSDESDIEPPPPLVLSEIDPPDVAPAPLETVPVPPVASVPLELEPRAVVLVPPVAPPVDGGVLPVVPALPVPPLPLETEPLLETFEEEPGVDPLVDVPPLALGDALPTAVCASRLHAAKSADDGVPRVWA